MPKRFVEGLVLEADSIDEAEERAILIRCSSKAASSTRPQSFSERTSTLFHAELVDREFGSALLPVADLLEWAKLKRLHLKTEPPIDGFEFVQVEALLCAIERPFQGLTHEQAEEIATADPALRGDRATRVCPAWLLGADAHLRWRKILMRATKAGELVLLDFLSKMPIEAMAKTAPVAQAPEKPLQRTAAQDAAILAAIQQAGYDPVTLPKNAPGKPGVRAAIRQTLKESLLFTGATVFDKAWERLRKRGEIADRA